MVPIFQNYLFYKIYGNYTYFFHKLLQLQKPMYITNPIHFIGMNKLKKPNNKSQPK